MDDALYDGLLKLIADKGYDLARIKKDAPAGGRATCAGAWSLRLEALAAVGSLENRVLAVGWCRTGFCAGSSCRASRVWGGLRPPDRGGADRPRGDRWRG